jgi:hypothetical protein
VTQFVIPLSNADGRMRSLGIDLPVPLTAAEWDRLHAVLEAMRPALVDLKPGDDE